MTARRGPIEVVGPVRIYAPSPSRPGRYRLKWVEPDGQPGDTDRDSLARARALAVEIAQRDQVGATWSASVTLAELTAEYVATGRSPYGDKASWARTTGRQTSTRLTRMLRRYGSVRAMDVDRDLCDRIRAEAGTDNGVRANTTDLRAFLAWGAQHPRRYFTIAQSELLPHGALRPQPALAGTPAPRRKARVRNVGEAEQFITDEDAPGAHQVRALSAALGRQLPAWGALAPEFAAATGARWGEQFQLTAPDVHLAGCAEHRQPHAHIRAQIDAAASAADRRGPGQGRCAPKGGKGRVVPLVETTFTGYRLRAAVADRLAAARSEQTAGDNPEALLFPAAEGGLLWYTGFAADHLRPAMKEAGWPLQDWVETRAKWDADSAVYTTIERARIVSMLPWHGLRHRFARTMIDHYRMEPGQLMAIGGWESIDTVNARYYRSGKEHTDSALGAIEQRDAPGAAHPVPPAAPAQPDPAAAPADAIRSAMALLQAALGPCASAQDAACDLPARTPLPGLDAAGVVGPDP